MVTKPTPDKNKLDDPVLTNDEVKRLLAQGYRQEKMPNGHVYYCRNVNALGSMVPKKDCTTGEQLKALAQDKKEFDDLLQQKAAIPRPQPSH